MSTYLNGWQIAIYRSTVNDVIVSTVAFVDVSDKSPCSIQNDWFNGYDAGNQMLYVSCGMPVNLIKLMKNYENKITV